MNTTRKFFVPIILTICIAFMMSCFFNSTQQVAYAVEMTDLQERQDGKVYCTATIDDDFADDKVLVVLADQPATQNAGTHTTLSATMSVSTFAEVGCTEVTNLTPYSSAIVDEHLAELSNPVSTLSLETKSEHKVNVDNFKKIISLKLANPGKQNVLDAIKKLEKRSDVLMAEPNYRCSFSTGVSTQTPLNSTDPDVWKQWAVNNINLPAAWSKSTGSQQVLVGVVDSGIDSTHPDLSQNINRLLSRDCSQNPIAVEMDPTDRVGHGTHVAGIIGANGNNGIGIAGVCWNISLVSLKIADASGTLDIQYAIRAIDYAASKNISILNCSFSGSGSSLAIRTAMENFTGLVVCAAGNDNSDNDIYLRSPCGNNDLNNVISVGAINQNNKKWAYSNYGATKVDLFAPGDGIYSTYPNNYKYDSGTSMAAPHVTGVAALLLSRYPDMSAGVLKASILEGVDKLPDLSGLCVTGGKLNADIDLKILNTSVVSKSGDKWTIRLTNPTSSTKEIIYNSKMCYESDAKNWTNFIDVNTVTLAAGSSRNIVITERLLATHIAFSYIDEGMRYITYSDKLNTNGTLSSGFAKVYAHEYPPLSIIGKNGSTWKIKITNPYSTGQTVQYNAKMCTLSDAENWSGLQDIRSVYISKGGSAIVDISENSFAPAIAVSFVIGSNRIVRYADNLNTNTTMTLHRNTLPLYMGLANSGKSGSAWKITITNTTAQTVTVYYNTKMCTEADAKNWTNLRDVSSFTLAAGASKTVTISERFLATSIAISFYSGSTRYISYANSLNTSGGINVMYNKV